jgi:ABC-type sugar transport system substrate-binding protein
MGKVRHNGVDAAIGLLSALARADGGLKTAALPRALGLPRASCNRILADLAAAGVLARSRGGVAASPALCATALGHEIAHGRPAGIWEERPSRHHAQNARRSPVALTAPAIGAGRRTRFRIGFSNASMDNQWRVALVHSVEHAAAMLGDRIEKLLIRQAGDSARRQAADILALVDEGVDGLIVSAVDAKASAPAVVAATARGVPVVLVDRSVAGNVSQASNVIGDDDAIGRTTALWLAETLGGRGTVLMLPGRKDTEPARRRLAAARAVLAGWPHIRILGVEWTGWRRDRAYPIVAAAIERWRGRIGGVWCDSGLQGVGSLQAFIAAGFRPGEIPPHTGGDVNLAYKLALRHRVRLAGVDNPPEMGGRAVELLHAHLSGKWIPAEVAVAAGVIITRGHATRSVKADRWAEAHVRWDLPDDLVLEAGLGASYNPRSFRIHYPGNRYNRSAALAAGARS